MPCIMASLSAPLLYSLNGPDNLPIDPDVVLTLVLIEEPLVPPEKLLLPLERLSQHEEPLSGSAAGNKGCVFMGGYACACGVDSDRVCSHTKAKECSSMTNRRPVDRPRLLSHLSVVEITRSSFSNLQQKERERSMSEPVDD